MLINSNPNINNNNNQFSNKPLNNYNPNLAKKNTNTSYKHQHNHLNNPNNVNHSNPNLFNRKNRPNTPNGPMKGPIRIKNDNTSSIIKKPTTPDTLSRLNKNTHSMYNNPIQRPNSVKKKQGPSNHHDIPHSRPSTAPHKDKINTNPMSRSNNTMINPNMRHNNNNNGINMMPGNGKRLPSPQIHSNNTLSKTQKVNPARYRAPSPVVKSSGNNAMMLGGTMKKGSYAYGKF